MCFSHDHILSSLFFSFDFIQKCFGPTSPCATSSPTYGSFLYLFIFDIIKTFGETITLPLESIVLINEFRDKVYEITLFSLDFSLIREILFTTYTNWTINMISLSLQIFLINFSFNLHWFSMINFFIERTLILSNFI